MIFAAAGDAFIGEVKLSGFSLDGVVKSTCEEPDFEDVDVAVHGDLRKRKVASGAASSDGMIDGRGTNVGEAFLSLPYSL